MQTVVVLANILFGMGDSGKFTVIGERVIVEDRVKDSRNIQQRTKSSVKWR